jgi:hypothetical protein
MLTRGLYLAITDDDLKTLRRTKDGPERRQLLMVWEEEWPDQWWCSTDKSWKILSRVLGYLPGPGEHRPEIGLGLGHDMFYGKSIHRPHFYVVGLIKNDWLPSMVDTLDTLDDQSFRNLYFSIPADWRRYFSEYHHVDLLAEGRCEGYWFWLQKIRRFFKNAAATDRHVIFTAFNC